MKAMSNEEFAERVMQMANVANPFVPTADYDSDGDCIEFLSSNENFYAERVDDLLTVYRSQETDEVIGSLIKGVSEVYKFVMKQCPGLVIEVHDGRIQLSHFFRAALWCKPPGDEVMAVNYKKLIHQAEKTKVEANFCVA